MLTFRYQAVDAGGRSVAGEIQATDVRHAQQLLRQQGLTPTYLQATTPAQGSSFQQPPPAGSPYKQGEPSQTPLGSSHAVGSNQTPLGSAHGVGRTSSPPGSPQSLGGTSPPIGSPHSVRGTLRRGAQSAHWEHSRVAPHPMALWLIQLRSMLKAGMSPANAFQSLTQRTTHGGLRRASESIARDTAQGISISDALAKFPDLFPAFLVGAFRAAEHGGYLPEMLDRLIAYYEQWRTVRRWSLLTQGCLWHAVLLLPLIAPFGIGLTWAFRDFAGNTTADALQAIGSSVWQAYLRYGLPATLLLMALMLLGYLLTGLERIGARLRLSALGFSTYADWIRAQSLEQYLFHLGRLTQAGVAPATAHALAAGAVPNRALADALLSVELGRAEGAAHIDHALERSGLFPIEEIMLARTGVQTGELPSILQTLAAWYTQRADENLRQLPRAFFRMMTLISIIATGIALISFAWGYYSNIFRAVDEFMGVGE
jgi:type II secretory pathway component PulF